MDKLRHYIDKYKELEKKYKLSSFREVFIFVLITLTIHFTYNFWARHYYYSTISIFGLHAFIPDFFQIFSSNLLHVSSWIVAHIPGLSTTVVNNTIYVANKGFVGINQSCSGLKQFIQFALLMMLYPGPWKKKLWFIPLGLLIVYLTNVFRIVGLVIVININPASFHFAHDNIFRPLFYVVIFLMWVYWVEKIKNNPRKMKEKINLPAD
jgi:exosortase/archaeosortase family protein